ncbi:MAG: lamin tail domain-containing protein [Pirellulales bacterium]
MRLPHTLRPQLTRPSLNTNRRTKRRTNRRSYQIESLEPRQLLTGVPIVTEFMAQNTITLADEDGTFSDWLEIHNPDPTPLSLENWHLTDTATNLTRWTFPAVTLSADQYLVVFASGKDRPGTGPLGEYHTNFALNNGGEYFALVHPNGTTVAQEFVSNGGEYPQQYADISYGLAPVTSEETYFLSPTPGAANSGPTSQDPARRITINEIMYHPSSQDSAEEYVELFNSGTTAVDVTGWQFSKGVSFTIPSVDASTPRVMQPGDYLVVAADVATFAAMHPAVNPSIVVGGWTGSLSDRYENIQLDDANGSRIDQVAYADDGDWADRVQLPPDGQGYRSWEWSAPHDGLGKTLELVSAAMSNNNGENWRPSGPDGGTPGAVNSAAAANIAPLISNVAHVPLIPHSNEAITVTADIRDELATGLTVNLRWRVDRANNSDPFQTATMFDDGAHGDGAAGDGLYGATIPSQANNAVVEFYVSATDAGARTRTWPAATDGTGTQGANALLQVDNTFAANWQPGNQSTFRFVMKEDERARLAAIQQAGGVHGSNASMNATFVSYDGTVADVRYRTGVRNRGGGTRNANGTAANYHLAIPHDTTWNGLSAVTINYNFSHSQVMGAALFQAVGQATESATPIQLRVNNADLAQSGNRMYGSYAWLETRGNDFVNNHFPNDNAGNFYTVNDDDGPAGDLDYRGTDFAAYAVSYHKQTNEELADWSDIVQLSDVMSNTPQASIFAAASTVAHLDNWARHFAIDTLLMNREGGLATGRGDDYSLYRGTLDTRFYLIGHDMDTLLGLGDGGFQPNTNIHNGYAGVSGLSRLFNDPQFLMLYHKSILDMLDGEMSQPRFDAYVDQLLTGWVPANVITTIKNNAAARRSYVSGVLPTQLTVASGLSTLGGIPRSTNSTTVSLSGTVDSGKTVSVTVNGAAASFDPRAATWSLASMPAPLHPGINRLIVRAFDGVGGTGNVVGETFIDIWNDTVGGAVGLTHDVPLGSTWSYLDNGSDQGTAWRASGFNESTWAQGPAQLGYGENDEATVVDCSANAPGVCNQGDNYITTYLRHHFTIPAGQSSQFTNMSIGLLRDDGAVVYLNGTEIVRSNMPGTVGDNTIDFQTTASSNIGGAAESVINTSNFDLSLPQYQTLIHDGDNVIAVELHQFAATSGDSSFDLRLHLEEQITGGGQNLSGTIAADRTLTAAGGPYRVTGTVTVAVGATLTVEPGTSVYFDNGAQLTINGRLLAEGTEFNQIRLTRTPNTTNNWNGIQFNNSMQDNRLSWAVVEWSSPTVGSNQGMVGLTASNLTVDHVYFDHAELRRIRSQNSSLIVRNSIFTDIYGPGVAPRVPNNFSENISGGGIPAGGHWIIENNYFGLLKGHNDGIDFDSSLDSSGPVAQILGNTFAGGGDDATDMLGYVYLDGNRFFNFHKDQYNTDPGQSNVQSSSSGHYTVVRNTYFDVDHVTLTKEDASTTFTNNTVYGPLYSAIYFDLAGQTSGPGIGADVDGSIFAALSNEGLFAEVLPSTQLSLDNSTVPAGDPALGMGLGTGNLDLDPRFVDPANFDFRLRSGSPAIGTGPNGLDMGAFVPAGASISGEPAAVTPLTSASLIIGGPGVTHYRYSVNGGAFTVAETPVATPLALSGLTNGTYSVRVIGKSAAGVWQAEAAAAVSRSWTVQTSGALPVQVVINEVLASNLQAVDLGGTRPDAIELYNRGDVATDLTGLSLSDNPNNPTKFIFPAGTTIPARGYLVLYADSLPSQSGEIHTGFSLRSEGEGVYLHNTAANGGTLLDSVEFGVQLADLSIARLPGTGQWGLAQPTFGAANRAQPLGDSSALSINEWFAKGSYTIGATVHASDFVELYNPSNYPVALGGLHLTDKPADFPTRHTITPLSFVAAGGYSVFIADGQPQDGANHLNFQLDDIRAWLGVTDADGAVIDQVLYQPQTTDYSQGRVPDGGPTYQYFAQPTPGLDSSPPSAPGNLHFTFVGETQADIAWDASSDPQSGVVEYRVYRGGVLLMTTTALAYTDATIVSGESYSYEVTAVNGDGVESAASNSLETSIDTSPPSIPTGLTGALAGANQVNLSWNPSADPQSGLKGYKVYRNGTLIASPTVSAYNDTAVPVGAVNVYEVSAVNNDDVESNRGLPLNVANFQDGAAPSGAYAGTADTWITANNETMTNGSATDIDIDGEDPLENLGMIRWDLSSIAPGNTIASALITVNASNGTNNSYDIFAALRNWSEADANWTQAAAGQNWQQPGAYGPSDRGTTVLGTVNGGTGVRTFVLNAAGIAQIQQWIDNPATNFGFIISNDNATDGIVFASSEAGNVNNRPRLVLSFNPPAQSDTTPPTVPAGLAASDDGASRITLTWSPADDPETGVTSYKIFRGGTQIGTSSTTSFVDTGRTPGTAYSYRVSAVNGVGLESAASTPPVNHTIAVDATPPTAPTGVVASDNGVSQITLSWAAAVDAQSGIASYKVYRDGVEVGATSTTSFADAGRTPEVDYSYRVAAVNGQNLTGPQSTPPVVHHVTPLPLTLQLQTRDSYLPGVAVLVRVEIQGSDGKPDRSIWDATATLSSSNPAVTLSTTTVQLRNGIGTALVTPSGSGPFTLNATANGLNASKPMTSLAGVAQTNVSGTLPGSSTSWSGVIHVTGDVTVPAGHTLTIQPGTLVLVNGTATPLATNGADIIVVGTLNSLGTAAMPVTITATNPAAPWGEINHTSSQPSLYQYTDITRGGHSPRGGHTNTGPAIRTSGSTLTFEHSSITDIAGKTMQGGSSNLVFRDTVFARSVMGPEIDGTGLLMEDGYIFDMLGIYREDGVTDDDDGIYIHRQAAGQQVIIRGGVIANADDDGIDTLGPDITIENIVIRDMTNTNDDPKAITILEGANIVRNVLMANVDIGISAKVQSASNTSTVVVDHVTILANSIAVQAEDKYGIPVATITYDIANSILRAPDAIRTDYDPAQITVNYTNASETWPGTGNQTADPLFVDAAGHDYHLQPTSPAIDAGDPSFALDADGTRTDMGYYPFEQSQSTIDVDAVLAGSSAWSAAFLARLASDGLGDGGYALATSGAALLPFTNVDRVSVRFSQAVSVTVGDLELHGVSVPNYAVTGVAYDPATFTATWSLAAPIAADKLLVRVRDTVAGQAGGSLAGDYTLRFDVLPGDANGDATVTLGDARDVARDNFRDASAPSFDPLSDLDGNGLVNIVDAVLARNHQGTSLPAGVPSSPAASPQAAAAVLASASRQRDTTTAEAVDRAVAGLVTHRGVSRLVAARRDRGELSARSVVVDNIIGQLSSSSTSLSAAATRAGRRSR